MTASLMLALRPLAIRTGDCLLIKWIKIIIKKNVDEVYSYLTAAAILASRCEVKAISVYAKT